MADLSTILLRLTKRLYPTGRAWKLNRDSIFERVEKALIVSQQEAYEAATSGILDTILPDNDNFTEDDAADWERRLAIRSSPGTTLEDRKLAIARKYASPGNIPARQHFLYLQGQLQNAGFNVFVHENKDGSGNVIPIEAVIGNQYGTFQYGQVQYGPNLENLDLVANFIDTERDNQFVLPEDLRQTFFIGGEILGSVASIPSARREEFRQLILSIKPLQTVGILLINYV